MTGISTISAYSGNVAGYDTGDGIGTTALVRMQRRVMAIVEVMAS